MSWVEDARNLLQDFVAPELCGIHQRIDDLLTTMKSSFEAVEKLAAERNRASVDRSMALIERIESMRRELTLQIDLAFANRKIQELQVQQQQPHHQQFR